MTNRVAARIAGARGTAHRGASAMTLTQLSYFLEVVKTGSITAAADNLQVAQPTISDQIRRLERTLGVELFIRLGRGTKVTTAGTLFVPHATRVIDAVADAEGAISELLEAQAGTLSVGVFGQAYFYNLEDVIDRFHRLFPRVTLKIQGANSSDVADAVRTGQFEAGVVVLPVDYTGLAVQPFFGDPIVYVSSDASRTQAPKTIEEFCAAPLVLYDVAWDRTDPTRRQLAESAQRKGLTILPLIDTQDFNVAIELVRRGVGDTFVGRRMLTRIDLEGLTSVPFAEPIVEEMAVLTRTNVQVSATTRVFLEMFVREVARSE